MPLGFFNIRFFNKNYEHYHTAIIITCFLVGLIFLILGVALISYSEIYVLSIILSCVFFGFGLYYVIDRERKKPSNKEIKTHANSRRVSRIGVILFLFIFGFVCLRIGLGVGLGAGRFYPFYGLDPTGVIWVVFFVIGALCLILALYLVKKRWF